MILFKIRGNKHNYESSLRHLFGKTLASCAHSPLGSDNIIIASAECGPTYQSTLVTRKPSN